MSAHTGDHRDSRSAQPYDEAEYTDALRRLETAAQAYYRGDTLVMDDDTYDTTLARVLASDALDPPWRKDHRLGAVGAGTSGDVAHSEVLLSLDNVFDDDALTDWLERLVERVGEAASFVVEPKLDGLAVAVRYEAGRLSRVITRGDGLTGEDVTTRAHGILGLPESIEHTSPLEVRGEIYLSHADFTAANDARLAAGKSAYVNPRNGAAGALRNQSSTGQVQLSFAAYAFPHGEHDSHLSAMASLERLGIATAARLTNTAAVLDDSAAIVTQVQALAGARAALGFDIDGAVVKLDAARLRNLAGSTSRAPRWAIAYKYPADTKLSTLLDITVQLGRTGVVTPVAAIEPVFVSGTTISSATLHNADEIARKDLRIGDTVVVRRAGEVIPEIVGRHGEHPAGSVDWQIPTHCPRCAGPLDTSSVRHRCTNRRCGLAEQLEHFCSRDAMDIEGLGATLAQRLVADGHVTDLADIYRLDVATLAGIDRLGQRSAITLVTNIATSKTQGLARLLCGIGLPLTSTRLTRRLAEHFGNLTALRTADIDSLAAVEGIGPVRAAGLVEALAELAGTLDALETAGLDCTATASATAPGPLVGEVVVVTGTVPGMTRTQAQEAAERLGAHVTGTLSSRTTLLVAGAGGGTKLTKARAQGVRVMDAGEFAALVGA